MLGSSGLWFLTSCRDLQLRIRLATRSTRAFTTSLRAFHSTNHDYETSTRLSRSPWRFSAPSVFALRLITYDALR